MLRRIVATVCCVALLGATFATIFPAQAQTNTDLRLLAETVIPGSNLTKFPYVAAYNGLVHVGSNVNRRDALVWTKAESALTFPDTPFQVGLAEGQPDYSTVAVATARNGDTYAAWVNQPEKRIYVRRRGADGLWEPVRSAVSNSPFPVSLSVGVASDNNTVLVVWRDPDQPAKYTFSPDRGLTWSPVNLLGGFKAYNSPITVATGPNGQIGVSWTGDAADSLQVFVAFWNGTTFDIERVTNIDGGIYTDASLSFAPNGTPYVAYRRDGTTNGAVFYSERQPNGTWPPSRLAGGSKIEGTVSITADEQGNLHFNWLARPGGPSQPFYAYRDVTGQFLGPIASSTTGALFNSRASAAVSDAIYSHMVMEQFSGSNSFVRYLLFQAPGLIFGADPVLTDEPATIRPITGIETILVNFLNPRRVTATTEVRWRWGAPPDDLLSDSGGWVPFANPMRIPLPDAIRDNTLCQTSTLFTQLRDPVTGLVEERVKQSSLVIDRVVEATATARNPFLASPTAATPALAAELTAIAGAPVGEENHTRVPVFYLDIGSDENGDCTGLRTFGIGSSPTTIETVYQITDNRFSGYVPFPNFAVLRNGPVNVTVQVVDGAGNQRNFTYTFVYDDEKPRLSAITPGTATAVANASGDLVQKLEFRNLNVRDNVQPAPGFWGLWVANSRTRVQDPTTADLVWTPVRMQGVGNNFDLNWSLANGLPASQVTRGDYFIYVRFLDAAGNASDGFFELEVTSNVERPKTFLPIMR